MGEGGGRLACGVRMIVNITYCNGVMWEELFPALPVLLEWDLICC